MKVFLSSTHDDLIEHRRAAHDALEQLGLHVIWMESFGARPEDSTVACLREVEESDLFVGIYAHRYGYIPDGKNVSITEEEFNHAQKLGKPIFGFIVTADCPWNPEMVEFDKKSNLDALLKRVKQQPIRFFTTPENLASSIVPSVGRYLLTELQKKAQGEGEILFKKLKGYLDSMSKKKVEDDLSSFLVNIQQASLLAKNKGIEGFAELIEFCLMRASLLTQSRRLPEEYYALVGLIDSPEKALSEVENIGNFGERALAYAALAASISFDLVQKEEFAQKALELTVQSGGKWEQSGNLSKIGRLVIIALPGLGIKAFRMALETIRKAKELEYIEPDIFDTPVKEFKIAFKKNPNVLSPILNEFISFVGKNGEYSQLLDLAKDLYENNQTVAREILEKAFSELTSTDPKSKIPEYLKTNIEGEIERNKQHFIEISLLLGEESLAKGIVQTTKLDFDLKNFSDAARNLADGNFVQAIETCSSTRIREEVIDRLFKANQTKEALQFLKPEDIEIANNYLPSIIKEQLVDELLGKINRENDENEIFSFFHEQNVIELKISLAKELVSTNPRKSHELLSTLNPEDEIGPFKFPYWGEAALITEVRIKWGEEKSNELIKFCVNDIDGELRDADDLAKQSKSIHDRSNSEQQIKDSIDEIKKLGNLLSAESNNFIYALSSYTKDRERLEYRLNNDEKIPPELKSGWEFIEKEDWTALEDWVKNFNYTDLKWWAQDKFVGMIRELVLKDKLDIANNLILHLELGTKWRAETWLSLAPTIKNLTAYDLEGFDEPSHIFLIRAEVMAMHSQALANAYVQLYCEFLVKEKWLDDMLGWKLCNLALFLYQHEDKVGAHKYFSLGIRHWFQSEHDDTWSEFTEDLIKTDFGFQFKLLQEILLWNSTRQIHDTIRTIQMFALALVGNFQYEQVVSVLSAIKRTRNWHLKDETGVTAE
jgi:hypothetical protein